MDRFIAGMNNNFKTLNPYLKSNMDRFIEPIKALIDDYDLNLKSNMDRFIVGTIAVNNSEANQFKIQYGQIYRKVKLAIVCTCLNLKSNMDRFIEPR